MQLLIDKQVSDAQNNLSAWSTLYDTYAAMMYGTILNLTGDERLSETILEDIFLELSTQKKHGNAPSMRCHGLLRHTYKATLTHLQKLGRPPVSVLFNGQYPLIHLFYFEAATLTDVARKMDVTEDEITRNLHLEFSQLCYQP